MDRLVETLGRLRKTTDRQSAFVPQESWNQFRVSPTCPPSTRLYVRRGRIYAGYNPTRADIDDWEFHAWTVPSLSADVADPDSVTIDVTFTTANYYQFFFLELRVPAVIEEPNESDWSFYLHGTGDEFGAAPEAELWLDSYDFQRSSPWDHGDIDVDTVAYPLCGLVLRNDGRTGVSGAILPIDLVNRGRSYIWPRDMRPITSIYD